MPHEHDNIRYGGLQNIVLYHAWQGVDTRKTQRRDLQKPIKNVRYGLLPYYRCLWQHRHRLMLT